MISIIKRTKHPNILGAAASGLCLIHCLLTPLFFTLQANTFKWRKEQLIWWQMIDLIFLLLSFIAVFVSATQTSKRLMRYSLWSSWIALTGIILNEKFQILHIMEAAIYIPSVALIVLHLYNRSYCRCTEETCCVRQMNTKTKTNAF